MKEISTDRGTSFVGSMRIALVLLVCWMVTGAALAQDESRPPDNMVIPDSLIAPDGVPLYQDGAGGFESMPRCLAHEASVPGQGLFMSGSTAGLVLGPITLSQPPDEVTVESHLPGEYLEQAVSKLPMPLDSPPRPTLYELFKSLVSPEPGYVVILVPDDFGPDGAVNGGFLLDDAVFTLGQADGSVLETLRGTGEFSHGALVLHHLNALIEAMGQFDVDMSEAKEGTFVWTRPGSNDRGIIVQGVRLATDGTGGDGHITIEKIAEGIDHAIEVTETSPPLGAMIRGYVLNMSWVLLPCATVSAFQADRAKFATFEEYVAALADDNVGSTPDALTRLLSWVSTDNDLYRLIAGRSQVSASKSLAFVAASGNFRLPYQMYPAAWPNVVGAGAYADGVPPPAFSNTAEVVAPGAWFKLARLPFDPPGASSPDISYAGTSFAAPFVSLFTALDMAETSPRCTNNLGSPTGLGSAPGLSSEPPANAWLADAQAPASPLLPAGTHCPY